MIERMIPTALCADLCTIIELLGTLCACVIGFAWLALVTTPHYIVYGGPWQETPTRTLSVCLGTARELWLSIKLALGG